MVDMREFAKPVHRSLLQRNMLGGIPQVGMGILILLGVIFIYGLELPITIVPLVLGYFVMRHLSKIDPWLIDILLENIMQKDKYIP